ncbi:hypothetical protein AX17_000223 [Amanita inopinata Kibby_2008]|nr:hypothetical protein AX17_000223 [Amanita inopinata Kibby_2008]
MSSAWGGDKTNIDENSGWSWGSSNLDSGSLWAQASGENPPVGWGITDVGDTQARHHDIHDRKTSISSSASGWAPPSNREEPTPRETRSEDVWSSTRAAASSRTREQVMPVHYEPYDDQRAPSQAPTELSSTTSAAHSFRPANPHQAFKAILKTMQQAVKYQVEYDEVHAKLEQWKKTRCSETYSRATPATRKKLETIRVELGQKEAEASKKLRGAINTLADLPDLSASQLAAVQYVLNDNEIARYTSELKVWVQQIEEHMTMEKKKLDSTERAIKDTESQNDSAMPQDPLSRNPANWTLDDIKTALSDLESRVGLIREQVHHSEELTTMCEEFRRVVDPMQQQLLESSEQKIADHLAQEQQQFQRIGDALANHTRKVADLLEERARLKHELATSKTREEEVNRRLAQCGTRMEKLELQMRQDEEMFPQVAEEVQEMLLQSPSASPTRSSIDDLLPPLQAQIILRLQDEIQPILEVIRAECLRHDKQLQAVVDEVANHIVDRTRRILENAQTLINPSI